MELLYVDSIAYCEKYGRLYDWNAAMKACPKGWHLPSDAEWETLVDFAGGGKVAGKNLKARGGWAEDGNGIDAAGFSALCRAATSIPMAISAVSARAAVGGKSATEDLVFYAYYWIMYYYAASMGRGNDDETYLFSVRCLRD